MRARDWDPKRPRPSSRRADHPRPSGSGRPPFQAKRHAGGRERGGPTILYGWHTVKAALENPKRKIRRIVATENALRRLVAEGVPMRVEAESVRPDAIAALVGSEAVHQGLYVEADPLPSPAIDAIAPDGVVLVLDQITDPHNVGALLRSAAAFAVSAIVTTARHSPEATGVLAKAASGALEYVPIVEVQNLARALEALRAGGFQLVGLDSEGEADLAAVALRAPVALVLGAEGKGLRRLTRATCDVLARLDMPGEIKSLNVSNAAALALFVATRRIAAPGR